MNTRVDPNLIILSPEDEHLRLRNNWYATKDGHLYFTTHVRGELVTVWLHKLVLGCANDEIGDHINRNPYDNRRENLRVVNASQNCWNRGKRKDNTSGVTGVSYHAKTGKWCVQISHHRKIFHVGLFTNIENAKAAYKRAVITLRGKEFLVK